MASSNTDIVRAIEEAWDQGRLHDLDQYFASEFDNAQSGTQGLPAGLAGSKIAHQGVMQSFPDRKIELLDLVNGGDQVFVRNRVTGTKTGGFPPFGVPANGNSFDFEAWGVYRLADGKVVEHWGMNDAFLLGIQLGAIPTPGG